MGEIKEFAGLNGAVNPDMYPDVDIDRTRVFKEKVMGIYHPAEELFYRDRRVLYQVVEKEGDSGFILVPGYKASEPYERLIGNELDLGEKMGDEKIAHNPGKTLAVKVEIIDEKDKGEIRGLIKKITGREFHIDFW